MLMETLEKNIPVWPPIQEQKMMLNKYEVAKRLDIIAKTSNHPSPRPHTYTISEASTFTHEKQTQQLVLKRNTSGNNDHIMLPPLLDPLIHNIVNRQNRESLGIHGAWFAQDYIENLKTMGEMRVYLCGLKSIKSTISTRFTGNDSTMEIEDVVNIPFLQETTE